MSTQRYTLEVQARLPQALAELEPISENLLYAWDRRVRGLFWRMDAQLWERCGHNPKLLLRRISQTRLDALATDDGFLEEYRYIVSLLRNYRDRVHHPHKRLAGAFDPDDDLIAYFCAEYGLHESLPIYSGGLGILAGDHCKAAGVLGLPFVGIGLMYRQGYFHQHIDRDGSQQAIFKPHALRDLPIQPVPGDDGEQLQVRVPMPGREVAARLWRAEMGDLALYLLDTDVATNGEDDRTITYQLYGGGREIRLAQELVLGVGGVRALRALGLTPSVWHVNEGHAALMAVERCREQVAAGLSFEAAVEATAAATVFTTHTPVAAGHDVFDLKLAGAHLAPYAEAMGVTTDRLLALGRSGDGHDGFNMTTLALRCSRQHNAVSAIHRNVTAHMEHHIWPEVPPEESPLQYVTNGVHIPTFLARQWANLLDADAPGWRSRQGDDAFWRATIEAIPDQQFWALRSSLKREMLAYVRKHLTRQYRRQQLGQAHIDRRLSVLCAPDGAAPMVMVFARRFATYKRATLLMRDPERLARLLNDPERPVVLLFAGKAHPADEPGQELLRTVAEHAARPEFAGKLFLLENYDLALARKLVAGADVWLNTPVYPLEACGTSGQKAAINGALNVSVLDGWWAEGYNGDNGWAIVPHAFDDETHRDHYEAEDLFDLLEDEVVPLYFRTDGLLGYSPGWIARARAAMHSILPQFDAQRMLLEYIDNLYLPAQRHGRRLTANAGAPASALVAWKQRVARLWPGVRLERVDGLSEQMDSGKALDIEVRAELNGLDAEDLRLECVLARLQDGPDSEEESSTCHRLTIAEREDGTAVYALKVTVEDPGLYQYRIRAYPHHADLAHPFETGLMRWL